MKLKYLGLFVVCGLLFVTFVAGCAPANKAEHKTDKKVLFYRNPMNPAITSPVPLKDEMGMAYIPVYEKEAGKEQEVLVPQEKQQLIGVKTEVAGKIDLKQAVRTAGRVAYDPDLYDAQTEFLQARASGSSDLAAAAKSRLRLLGMSEAQIARLTGEVQADETLLRAGKTVWVYADVYENELPQIAPGQRVKITASALPGREFYGRVAALDPVLDRATRSAKVRVEVAGTNGVLLPESFVNVEIEADLGRKLAISREAVLDSGLEQRVFIDKGDGYFEPRKVKLGVRTDSYVEIVSGVAAGERVVTSGNFLIDSEARLKEVQ